MKASILAILFVAIFSVALGADLGDGRPGCRTDAEMQKIYYRNFWDANAYWECRTKGVAAEAVRCDQGGFQPKLGKCVDWEEWEWESPVPPPSRA